MIVDIIDIMNNATIILFEKYKMRKHIPARHKKT